MQFVVQEARFGNADSICNFLNFYYCSQMRHLASDLLDKGLSPEQNFKAVIRALRIAK